MRLSWLTDIHLNFLEEDLRQNFYQEIIYSECDGVLISGDIAEATSIAELLKEMAHYIKKPIYYILGNHDYYRGQVDQVRNEMTELTNKDKNLFWLPASGIQILNENTILLGQDGWADGRLGDYQNSPVGLNDSRLISDLFQKKILGKNHVLKKMQELADEDAKKLNDDLEFAVGKNPNKIIILTHVPPFRESCMHLGKISDDDWLPYFSSKVTGDVLMNVANKNSGIEFLVLCGHTHSSSHYQPLDNLCVKAGAAEYYRPQVQEVIKIYCKNN